MHAKLENLLREYIQLLEYDEEAEEKLKKRAKDQVDYVEVMLLKHDITPIVRKDSSWLASGAFSRVFEVSYHGKHCVAKVSDREEEIRAIEKISELRHQVEPRLAKHLPIVYETFYDEETKTYVAVVERLVKLEPHIINILFQHPPAYKITSKRLHSQIIPLLKSDRVLKTIIVPVIKKLVKQAKLWPDLENIIINEIKSIKFSEDLEDVENDLDYSLDPLIYSVADFLTGETSATLKIAKSLISLIKEKIIQFVQHTNFPEDYREQEHIEIAKTIPGAESLVELLELLRDQFNIKWDDLHGDNLMQRPKTRDIVIADPGLFEFGK
jgi:hypothetical protein